MKKLHKLALAAALAVSVAAPTAFLGAQTDAELGVSNTGLLPSNPLLPKRMGAWLPQIYYSESYQKIGSGVGGFEPKSRRIEKAG